MIDIYRPVLKRGAWWVGLREQVQFFQSTRQAAGAIVQMQDFGYIDDDQMYTLNRADGYFTVSLDGYEPASAECV